MLRSTAYKLKIFFKQICSISVVDSHLFIYILGCKIRKKLKTTPKTVSVNTFGLNADKRKPGIIASLTSFPQRIGYVHNTISNLLSHLMTIFITLKTRLNYYITHTNKSLKAFIQTEQESCI